MNVYEAIPLLDQEWDRTTGFLGLLRMGHFDNEGLVRLIAILRSVELSEPNVLDRRFVALVWSTPLFISWQKARVEEVEGNGHLVDDAFYQVLHVLDDVLGIP